MRIHVWTLATLFLLAPAALRAAALPCGAHDLTFGCTHTEEKGRPRVGCAVHDGPRFFTSEWRVYDLQTEEILALVSSNPEGIALVDLPGFPDAAGLVDAYAAASGRDCGTVSFHLALAAFKLAIIGEGNRARMIRNGAFRIVIGDGTVAWRFISHLSLRHWHASEKGE